MAWWDDDYGSDIEFEDQTDLNNGGDTSIGNEYDGYTPGGDNTNIDTSYDDFNYDDFWNSFGSEGGDTTNSNNFFGGIDTTGLDTGTGATWNAPNAGGIQNTLAGIFSGGLSNPLIGKGLSALMEGYQNKQKQAAMNKIATTSDPFGSQRSFYQTQARNAVTNPYNSPIVKAQIEQLQRAQSIKDAAAGRRSNTLTSSPAVMAQMAQITQQYQNQMATQGGANIAPSAAGISAATSGANAGVNGYISPLLSLLGNTQQTATNSSTNGLEALQKFLQGNQ